MWEAINLNSLDREDKIYMSNGNHIEHVFLGNTSVFTGKRKVEKGFQKTQELGWQMFSEEHGAMGE